MKGDFVQRARGKCETIQQKKKKKRSLTHTHTQGHNNPVLSCEHESIQSEKSQSAAWLSEPMTSTAQCFPLFGEL